MTPFDFDDALALRLACTQIRVHRCDSGKAMKCLEPNIPVQMIGERRKEVPVHSFSNGKCLGDDFWLPYLRDARLLGTI